MFQEKKDTNIWRILSQNFQRYEQEKVSFQNKAYALQSTAPLIMLLHYLAKCQ